MSETDKYNEHNEVDAETKYGVRLSDLNDENLGKILEIFDEIYKGRAVANLWELPPTGIIQGFDEEHHGVINRSVSTKFSPRSKLIIESAGLTPQKERIVRFRSNPNEDSRSEQEKKEMEETENAFEKTVSNYLHDNGIGIELPKYR